jgi:hypothetical protein
MINLWLTLCDRHPLILAAGILLQNSQIATKMYPYDVQLI